MPRERAFGLAFIALGVGFAAQSYMAGSAWSTAMLVGDALILSSALAWAFYSVLAKRWGFHPWLLTRFVAFSSALIYLPVYLLWLPKQLDAVPMSTLVLQGLYQGVGATIVAMLLVPKAVEKLGAERVGALIALVPVLAGVAAAPLLGEALTAWLLAGLVCVSLGAFVAARPIARLVPAACPATR